MAMQHERAQSLVAGRTSAQAGHVGRGPGPVEEHEARRIEIGLALESRFARSLHVLTMLLGGLSCFFVGQSRASRKLQSAPSPTVSARSPRDRARISPE